MKKRKTKILPMTAKKNQKGRPGFRPYRPAQAQKEMLERRKDRENRSGQFDGYSIQVLNLSGKKNGAAAPPGYICP